MIVVDASLVVELFLRGPLATPIKEAMETHDGELIAPHLLDLEVLSAFRGLAASQGIDIHRSGEILSELAALPAERYSHTNLIKRIWELRHNFTVYDATYIALAEATDSILFTCDAKLRRGHRARVRVFAYSIA